MDISSLNSFLHVTSKPHAPSPRNLFDRIPTAVMNLIVQHFLPAPQERNKPLIRLMHAQILQSKRARYPDAILFLGLDVEKEFAWKNTLDHVCRARQQRQAANLLMQIWKDPMNRINHPFFPSPIFNKQPCITYVEHHFPPIKLGTLVNHEYGMLRANKLIENMQKEFIELMSNTPNPDLEKQLIPSSFLTGAIAVGGVGCSVVKAVCEFKLPISLVVCAVLFIDLESRKLTIGSVMAITGMGVSLLAVSIAAARTIWQTASVSVRERVGLAQLFLLAKRARATEN